MNEYRSKALKNSSIVAFTYVGLGTLSLFAINSDSLISDVAGIFFLLTLPVSFLGFGILYGEGPAGYGLMLGVQLLVFLIFWYAVYRVILHRYKHLD
jgi:hypothetical protein